MPMSPDEFYQHVHAHTDSEGRLPLSRMTGWEIFPFEPDGLTVVPIAPPSIPEAPRHGEDPSECGACHSDRVPLWSDGNWQVFLLAESGAPLVLGLQSRAHYDLPTLPDELGAELGRLVVHLSRSIEGLPHVARAHFSRWGDGGAHLHLFVYARPAGFPQLRGTCLAVWDDLLPAMPTDIQRRDAELVANSLASSFGGVAGSAT
jgi:hypothetical protein